MTTITSTTNGSTTGANPTLYPVNTEKLDAEGTLVEQEITSGDSTDNNVTSVTFSSRAQKIQLLNDEFFGDGPASVKITPDFIERLYEFGFITADDATKFGASSIAKGSVGTLGKLSSFTEDFSEKLLEYNPDDNFAHTLQEARSIIDNFDSAQPTDFSANIKLVSSEMGRYLAGEQDQPLSVEDRNMLEQLHLSLLIADRLSPGNISSEKINSYLANIAGA